jgi:AAA15 family ATPase/GTPase
MFIMTVLAARQPHAGYYFLDLPETSLHVMLARKIVEYLMGNFCHMKFVFATHSTEIASFEMDHNGEEEQKYVICLPENYLEDEAAK